MEAKRQTKNYILAVAVSLAMFCMGQIPGSIDAAIEEISSAFNLTSTTGMYVTTVACIVSVVFSIILGFIAGKKVGYKPLVLFCAIVEVVSALVPFVTSKFIMLIVLRGIFGIGFGGMQSMENTVTTILIPVEKRARILGMGMFVGFGMNCILQLLGGVLAERGWNYVFLNHILLFIPLVIIIVGCMKMDFTPADETGGTAVMESDTGTGSEKTAKTKAAGSESETENKMTDSKPEKETVSGKEGSSQTSGKLGLPVFQCWIMMLLVGIFIAPLLVGCSFLSAAIIDSTTVAGVVAVCFSLGCMIGGLIYPKLFSALKKKSLPFFLLLMAIGILGCGISRSVVLLCVLIFVAGLGFSMTLSCAMMILGLATSTARIAMVSAIMMALYNLGMFLSSSFENVVGRVTGDSLYMPLYIGGILTLAVAVIYLIVSPMRGQKLPE
ncbi:MAG: MFS transporter [Clostridiales bacterium]|nr:MFS transporter [Clostridiales bacterium]